MTVRRGEIWGTSAVLPPNAPVANTDAQLAACYADHAGPRPLTVGLLGGDIWRALGEPAGGSDRLFSQAAVGGPIDLLQVTVGQTTLHAAAHVVARTSTFAGGWLRGPAVVVSNGEWCGPWKVAPAAHPNDGFAHCTQLAAGALSVSQRLAARKRAHSASHLPHDGLGTSRSRERLTFSFAKQLAVFIDGKPCGKTTSLCVEVIPDALSVVF